MEATLLGIPVWHYVAVACVSFAASIVGGLAGYGTGFCCRWRSCRRSGRSRSCRSSASRRCSPMARASRPSGATSTPGGRGASSSSLPCTVVSATFYTWLSGRGVSLLLGLMLLLLVPLRRLLARLRFVLGKGGLVPAAAVYGTLAGGTTGSGVVLISILMASGLQGSAVVATDAIISLAIGLVKTLTFGLAGALGLPLVVLRCAHWSHDLSRRVYRACDR